jgi:hypothetical protein
MAVLPWKGFRLGNYQQREEDVEKAAIQERDPSNCVRATSAAYRKILKNF